MKKIVLLSLCFVTPLATTAHAEVEVRVLVSRGVTPLPLPDGSTTQVPWAINQNSPGHDGAAHVAADGTIYFGGIGHQWRVRPDGTISRILSVGEQAPGLPTGVVIGGGAGGTGTPTRLGLVPSGQSFYYSRLTGPSITAKNNQNFAHLTSKRSSLTPRNSITSSVYDPGCRAD